MYWLLFIIIMCNTPAPLQGQHLHRWLSSLRRGRGVECRCVWNTRDSRRISGRSLLHAHAWSPFGPPFLANRLWSIYIDGWLYGMRMTSVVCNVPVLSQNDSTYHHSVFTTWKWHPFATWTPSFIILVWGHHPLIGAKLYLPASRTLVIIKTAKRK